MGVAYFISASDGDTSYSTMMDDKVDSLQDLNDMLSILKILDDKGLRWHLTIDI
jgi:hypothetical protein